MMGQIEVLYDLGEPYVPLENYRAVQVRAATLAAEVERLTAERDEWMETAETTESELCQFMDDLIAVVGEQVIVGDEVKFSAIVTAVAALRDQPEAGYRPVGEPESWPDGRIEIRPIGTPIFARVGFFLDSPDGIIVVEDDEVGDFICYWRTGSGFEWRPAPPQE